MSPAAVADGKTVAAVSGPLNILSIDLEDWNQLACWRTIGEIPPVTPHNLQRQMDCLLALLAETRTRATFFVLGRTAEENSAMVKQVASAGHEIASHGYAHKLVHTLSRQQFAEDTRRSKQFLEELTGQPVLGYRAAEFSTVLSLLS